MWLNQRVSRCFRGSGEGCVLSNGNLKATKRHEYISRAYSYHAILNSNDHLHGGPLYQKKSAKYQRSNIFANMTRHQSEIYE